MKREFNKKCCENCCHYENRTHFCRLNPPQPILFYNEDGDEDEKSKVSSKFPVITLPGKDYCSYHESNGNM